MDYKKIGKSYWLRIDRSEEIVAALRQFAAKENVTNASVSGLGAVNRVVAGLYDTAQKRYVSNTFEGDMEIVSLLGSITIMNGEAYLHLHIGLADASGKMFGGHLNEAVVSGTCELNITVLENGIGRKYDEDIGLNLLDFNQ